MSGAASAETDAPGDGEGEGPLRRCIVSREERPPEELIRFVVAPDGTLTPDLARRLPGRGAWVTAGRAAVAEAVRTRAFAKSFKRQLTVASDLADLVERLMRRRLVEAVAIANKAGLAVAGFAKVEAAVSSGRVLVLLHARDAADDGVRKLDGRLAGQSPGGIEAIRELENDELSLAMGRANVVHAALEDGGASRRVVAEARRLRHYRTA